MTKADIVAQIAQQTGVNRTVVLAVVEAFMKNIKDSMVAGDDVFLRGFGSFVVKQRGRKVARNISKNTSIVVPAHSVPVFRPAKEFMDMVKEGR